MNTVQMNSIQMGVCVFLLEILLQGLWIKIQNSAALNFAQKQKDYGPRIDVEKKASTPSMGGVVFLVLGIAAALTLAPNKNVWIFATACGLIGFADDALKFFRRSSEGFSSLKKLGAQIIVSLIYAIWASLDYGYPIWLGVPVLVFLSVGLQNAVNVSDGLDGLAAGLTAISLVGLAALTGTVSADIAIALGITLGFLWHNSYPARIFMGDTGSHFLAGMLFALIVNHGNLLTIVPVGFFFGIEILTVAIQIIAIRKFKRKIFKMAPLHHHFQLSGWKETTIVNRFWLVHIVGMAVVAAVLKGCSLI